jgi:hypothetical protein
MESPLEYPSQNSNSHSIFISIRSGFGDDSGWLSYLCIISQVTSGTAGAGTGVGNAGAPEAIHATDNIDIQTLRTAVELLNTPAGGEHRDEVETGDGLLEIERSSTGQGTL